MGGNCSVHGPRSFRRGRPSPHHLSLPCTPNDTLVNFFRASLFSFLFVSFYVQYIEKCIPEPFQSLDIPTLSWSASILTFSFRYIIKYIIKYIKYKVYYKVPFLPQERQHMCNMFSPSHICWILLKILNLNSRNLSKSHATPSCVNYHPRRKLFHLRSWLSLRKSMLVQLSKLLTASKSFNMDMGIFLM